MDDIGNKYWSFFENSADAMLIIANGAFVDCNSATVEMLGYDSKAELINKRPSELSPEFQPDGCLSVDKADEMIRVAGESGNHRFEWDHLKKDGSVVPVEVTLTAVKTNGDMHLHTIWRDISERKQAEKALKESEERFRYTYEANPDPVIFAKLKDGLIIDVNSAFEERTGIPRKDALGRNSEELQIWHDNETRKSFLQQLITSREINNFEADFKVKGNQLKTGLISARILPIENEPCMLITIRDITREKAAERALVQVDKAKSDFISTAGHELRSPLTAIMGFTDLLLLSTSEDCLSEERKVDFLHEIYERGEILNRMIDDFLDLSRIESGLPIPMLYEQVDLFDVLNRTISFYQLHKVEHNFELALPDAVSAMVEMDRHRINQVLENLLSNAVKYSDPGTTVVVDASLIGKRWQITVKDQGHGMSPDQLSKVFDKFYRANPSVPGVDGLGLGMSIVRSIIEAHNGTISIESKQGEGTVVSFTLPVHVHQ